MINKFNISWWLYCFISLLVYFFVGELLSRTDIEIFPIEFRYLLLPSLAALLLAPLAINFFLLYVDIVFHKNFCSRLFGRLSVVVLGQKERNLRTAVFSLIAGMSVSVTPIYGIYIAISTSNEMLSIEKSNLETLERIRALESKIKSFE